VQAAGTAVACFSPSPRPGIFKTLSLNTLLPETGPRDQGPGSGTAAQQGLACSLLSEKTKSMKVIQDGRTGRGATADATWCLYHGGGPDQQLGGWILHHWGGGGTAEGLQAQGKARSVCTRCSAPHSHAESLAAAPPGAVSTDSCPAGWKLRPGMRPGPCCRHPVPVRVLLAQGPSVRAFPAVLSRTLPSWLQASTSQPGSTQTGMGFG